MARPTTGSVLNQRPRVAIITDENDLSLSLAKRLIKNFCKVDIISEESDHWRSKISLLKNKRFLKVFDTKEKGIDKNYSYIICLNLYQGTKPSRGKIERKTEKRLVLAMKLAKENFTKSLFVFPYVQKKYFQKQINAFREKISKEKDLFAAVLFIGELVGPEMNFSKNEVMAEMLEDTRLGFMVRVPRIKRNLYPVAIKDVTEELVKNLFSFGAFDKETAIVSRSIPTASLFKLLKKQRPKLYPKYTKKIREESRADVLQKILLEKNFEKIVKETLGNLANEKFISTASRRKPLVSALADEPLVPTKSGLALRRNAASRRSRALSPVYTGETPSGSTELTAEVLRVGGGFISRERKKKRGVSISQRLSASKRLLSKEVSRKWLSRGISLGVVIIMFPVALLFISALSLVFAKTGLEKGNFDVAKGAFRVSRTTSEIANNYLMTVSKTSGIEGAISSLAITSKVLVKASDLGLRGVSLANSVYELLDRIKGEEIYDISFYTEKISLELDYLYREIGFLQGDVSSLNEIGRAVVSKVMNEKKSAEIRERVLLAKGITEELPVLLGKERPRSYLVLFQNNLVLRPTGGLIESFALVSFSKGRLTDLEVFDVYSADKQLKGHVEPPKPIKDYLEEESWLLRDSNWNPDFPTTAVQAEWFLDKEVDRAVDGVIAIDLELIKRVLGEIGPLTLVDFNEKISERNLYEITLRVTEVSYSTGDRHESHFMTAFSKKFLARLLELSRKEQVKVSGAILEGLEEKHVQLFFHNIKARRAISEVGWDGAVSLPDCSGNCLNDWLGIVEASLGKNAAGYFINRVAELSILFEEGVVKRKLSILLENLASANHGDVAVYKSYIRVLSPPNSGFSPIIVIDEEKREKFTPEVFEIRGHKEAGVFVEIGPGEIKTLLFSWESAANLDYKREGEYRLCWRKQAGTLKDPIKLKFNFPKEVKHLSIEGLTLTADGSFGYNSKAELARDFYSRIFW